jgi:hypothetical protein
VKAHDLRKPALDLSDVVRQPCTLITGASSELPITRIAVVVGQSGPPLYIDSGPETVHSPTTLMGGWNIVGTPALVPAGMMGDRADVIFASPDEISGFIAHQC